MLTILRLFRRPAPKPPPATLTLTGARALAAIAMARRECSEVEAVVARVEVAAIDGETA